MNHTGNSSGRNYAAAAALIVVAALFFAFLSGSTAVFVGIVAAVAGAVLLVMGIQAANDRRPYTLERDLCGPPETTGDSASDVDWDEDFAASSAGAAPAARRRHADKQVGNGVSTINTLKVPSPDELKDVVREVFAGTFDLPATGVLPEDFFNFRRLRKPCKASEQLICACEFTTGQQSAEAPEATLSSLCAASTTYTKPLR